MEQVEPTAPSGLPARIGAFRGFLSHVQAEMKKVTWPTRAELIKATRMVVILADLEDFSYKEIAEILDCPVGTVMSRLYRGRKLLEKALLRYARRHGYIRGGEPAKMRTRPKTPAA